MKDIDWGKLAHYAKAVAAFLTGVATTIGVFVSVASDGSMTGSDWMAVLAAVVGTGVGTQAVKQVKNKEI